VYIRIARFEGMDPSRLDDQIDGIRHQIDEGRRRLGEAEMTPVEVEGIKAIDRVLMVVDREGGRGANIVFCASEDDVRKADAFLSSMTPDRPQGQGVWVDMYVVAIDERPGAPLDAAQK
jgi:hypothetical protein